MEPDRFRRLVDPFAKALHPLVAATRDEDLALTPYQQARLRETISVIVRKICDIVVPAARAPEVSVQAAQAAQLLGVDLRRESWQSQPSFDPGRVMFHYEHMRPVGSLTAAIIAAQTPEDIVDVLQADLRVAWITKEEDAALTSLGYRTRRPDPDAAYAEAGIALTNPHIDDPSPPASPVSPLPLPVQESGFMPVHAGDTFNVVQLGLCLGGLVLVHAEVGTTAWSVGADATLFDSQARGFLARTRHGNDGFREAALFDSTTGTLLLRPRQDADDKHEAEELTFHASAVQLAPPEQARDSWSDELQAVLARAVETTLAEGWQLRVEIGGWDAPRTPYCSVETAFTAEATPVLYFEASPPPSNSRWWEDRMRPIGADTVKLTLSAADFDSNQTALLLRDALDWNDVSPWDLALTYAKPPKAVTNT